ncbi:MAG TPA: aminotransferase class V-fold PLP-dependent enzyme [Saprospiraceae bacterium]|nr:aminotransferase class V-fold PLP-dependent enzyme [Saprospiraceae bacterium]
MEEYFKQFRKGIIGINQIIQSPFSNELKLLYADWTASGRMYSPIEEHLKENIYPFVANTHTETNSTGKAMTEAYHKALHIIKKHVNASSEDLIISSYSGMTGVVNKFQRILGLRLHEKFKDQINLTESERPVVFITHMEHHSNQTSWLETIADVEIIQPDSNGLVDLEYFQLLLDKYKSRKVKFAAVTSCSNVTGIFTPYHKIAAMIHAAGGYCFVDFACSAPYVEINMHPIEPDEYLDAIYFSPHKFLGGPGSTGIIIFNKKLYQNKIPDNPGGGTVDWTNPWGEHKYLDDIESREDGGTPAFLQTIRTALCIKLKEEMGVQNIKKREQEIVDMLWSELNGIEGFNILEAKHKDRLCVVSFYIEGLHYNLGVKMLNDRFGIQVRGGCSCAGTYGHYILNIDKEYSKIVTEMINAGDYSSKAGWIRLSLHPTNTNEEVKFVIKCLKELSQHHLEWAKDYTLDLKRNEISFKDPTEDQWIGQKVKDWFNPKHLYSKQ